MIKADKALSLPKVKDLVQYHDFQYSLSYLRFQQVRGGQLCIEGLVSPVSSDPAQNPEC